MSARWLLLVLALLLPGAWANLAGYDFTDAAEERRFKALIAELRCLVCQNQSLGDSDAGLAEDLRREVFDLMREGRDDREVIDYLVARYGDFVLYRPPLKPATYLLWFGPIALFALAVWFAVRTVRNQRASAARAPLSEAEQQRIARLLSEESPPPGGPASGEAPR